MPLRLEITEDGVARGLIELPPRGSFVLGRHESCELVVKGSGVSRRHALLSIFQDEFAIQDLASKNGTYVNGKEAKTEVLLGDGDAIRLGRAVLMGVKLSDEPVKARKIEGSKPVPVVAPAAPDPSEAMTIPPDRSLAAPAGWTSCMSCDRPVPVPSPRIGVLRLDDGAVICPSCTTGLAKRDRMAKRYRLLAKIGEGAVATVFKAIDEDVRRIVAVKKMKAKTSDLAVAYLEREVEILRSLDHPGIVRLLDAGEHEGDRFLVMELVQGADLESLIEAHTKLNAIDAAQIGFELASALALAHRRGVVHRDVKPSNVLIDRSGKVKLVDFGVARLGKQTGNKKGSERLTIRGSRRGTPAYMAPEQALDPANAGPPADVYGVAATLYHVLSGAPPYGAKATANQVLEKLDRGEPPADFEGSDTSQNLGLTTVVRRALEHDPAKRYPDADGLRVAFAELLGPPSSLAALLDR